MDTEPNQQTQPGLFRGITRNTFVLGLVSLFNDISAEMVAPLVPVFMKSVLGASAVWVGIVEGLAQTTASVLKPAAGWLSDKTGKRRPLIFLGYCLGTLSRPVLAVSTAAWHVLGSRFVDRVGKGARTAPRDAMIADSTPKEFRGKAFGFQRALDSAGAAIGMLAAALILFLCSKGVFSSSKDVRSALRTIFLISVVPGMVAVALVTWAVREPARPKAGTGPAHHPVSIRSAVTPALLRWYAVLFVFWLGNSADAFLILKARLLNMAIWEIPLLMFCMSTVRAVFVTPAGAISDRLGRRGIILTGWVYYAAVYFGFAFADRPWMIYGLFSAYGLYYALTEGAERALVTDLAPQTARGTALGLYHFVVGLAAFPASVICGLLWEWDRLGAYGPHVALGFGAVCALTASVLFFVFNPCPAAPVRNREQA